jgi:hypothetical protein
MIAQIATLFSRPLGTPSVLALGCVTAVALAACNKNESGSLASHSTAQRSSTSTPGTVSMCKLMPKEDVNAAIGSSYTIAEASDQRSESSCHYSSETDPAGLSLDLQWIEPSDYSSPAEHAALQAAGMGGAKLGGKLTESVVPNANAADGGPLHIRSGPVEGVGDEATQSMLLLTARKGDYTLMVQIVPDPMKLLQDSTAGPQVQENERKLARSVFAKV